jgi:uncharacterized membrane protein
MTIGPLQLVLIKFSDEQRTRPISEELRAVRKTGIIRLVDLLYVYKDLDGVLHSKEISDVSGAAKAEYGILLQGLLGMRAAHKTGGDVDKIAEAMSLSPGDFGLSSEQVQQIANDLPNGGSAMLTLFEHVWAIRLKEALLNAGGELIAQGLLSPEALAVGGTTLDDAIAAAQKIEADAEGATAAQIAEADQKLAQAKSEAEVKLAEAQRVLDDAEAQAASKMEQAKIVAAAAIAASVRTAAEELQKAETSAEQSKMEADALLSRAGEMPQQRSRLALILPPGSWSRKIIADDTIAQGIQTAEEIKSAAALEALKILVEAQLIRREATRQAISILASAVMIEQAAAEESLSSLLASDEIAE